MPQSISLDQLIKKYIRDVPDFPKPGIIFKDITPLLKEPKVFDAIIRSFAERYRQHEITLIAGIESRGFIFGAALARELKAGFIPVRKQGKLPHDTVEVSYDLEYGTATIEVHRDAIGKGDKVLVIDDLLATGGTAEATCKLVERLGGTIVECAFVVELGFLHGRSRITHCPVYSLVTYS